METRPKLFVFVLMPFKEEFNDIYELGIEAACEEAGAFCQRVDRQIFFGNMLERIYNQIAKADVIVADVTGQNPNVFYEIGYAHALNKQVILLVNNSEGIPFDLKHYPHIIYKGQISKLKTELKEKISWCVNNPQDTLKRADVNLQFLIDGTPLTEKDETPVTEKPAVSASNYEYVYFNLDIHNPAGVVLEARLYSLALILPKVHQFFDINVLSSAKISDEQYIYTLEQTHNIFPFGWHSLKIKFGLVRRLNIETEAELRFYTEFGYKDYAFVLNPRR
jgi:hypothetical protein